MYQRTPEREEYIEQGAEMATIFARAKRAGGVHGTLEGKRRRALWRWLYVFNACGRGLCRWMCTVQAAGARMWEEEVLWYRKQ